MILRNQARCLQCGDFIMSVYRHDLKRCKCGELAVDGGVDYVRRLGNNYEELSISIPVNLKPCEAADYLGVLTAMEYGVIHTTLEIFDLMITQERKKYWFSVPGGLIELGERLCLLVKWDLIDPFDEPSIVHDCWTLCQQLAPWPENAARRA